MEAGYDYMLLHPPEKRRQFSKAPGVILIVLGAVLLVMAGAFYTYGATARADLMNMEATLPWPTSEKPEAVAAETPNEPDAMAEAEAKSIKAEMEASDANKGELVARVEPSTTEDTGPATLETSSDGLNPERVTTLPVFQPETEAIIETMQPAFEGTTVEPTSPQFWIDTSSYEAASPDLRALVESFNPIGVNGAFPLGSRLRSTRLSVPSAGIDSAVVELKIEEFNGFRAYETPNRSAGHIPETANPGEAGSAWFFGHTETPLMGEGSVFFNLVKIPELLKQGRDVFVIAESEEGQYLYRLVSSQVVHEEDIRLYDSGGATIHLVSCVPRLVYDHRLIVSGELVGHKGLNRDT